MPDIAGHCTPVHLDCADSGVLLLSSKATHGALELSLPMLCSMHRCLKPHSSKSSAIHLGSQSLTASFVGSVKGAGCQSSAGGKAAVSQLHHTCRALSGQTSAVPRAVPSPFPQDTFYSGLPTHRAAALNSLFMAPGSSSPCAVAGFRPVCPTGILSPIAAHAHYAQTGLPSGWAHNQRLMPCESWPAERKSSHLLAFLAYLIPERQCCVMELQPFQTEPVQGSQSRPILKSVKPHAASWQGGTSSH